MYSALVRYNKVKSNPGYIKYQTCCQTIRKGLMPSDEYLRIANEYRDTTELVSLLPYIRQLIAEGKPVYIRKLRKQLIAEGKLVQIPGGVRANTTRNRDTGLSKELIEAHNINLRGKLPGEKSRVAKRCLLSQVKTWDDIVAYMDKEIERWRAGK